MLDATDSNVDYLRNLNPELRRDVTPRGDIYNVRVPAGRSETVGCGPERIPGDKRDTARVISVAPGEDLQAVANRTGISVSQLQAFNSGVDLKSSTKLVVPNGNLKLTNWRRTTADSAPTASPTLTRIRARKGETIAMIAAAHNVNADELARLNNLSLNGQLQGGQEIRLLSSPSSAPAQKRRHHR
jgi:membrane-bound lytic murein transglycosylase D